MAFRKRKTAPAIERTLAELDLQFGLVGRARERVENLSNSGVKEVWMEDFLSSVDKHKVFYNDDNLLDYAIS